MKYIDPHNKLLAHPDLLAAWKRGEKPAPLTVEWDLSNRCDLKCNGCHFAYTHTRGPWAHHADKPYGAIPGGDLADTQLVRQGLYDMARAGVKSIIWSGGGEPTLHPDFDLIVDTAFALGFEQGIYTHGGHITPERATLMGHKMTWAVISLDAATEEEYAKYKGVGVTKFHDACNGIYNLSQAGGCVVGVSFLLSKDNWQQAWAMLDLARSFGASYTTFRPLVSYAMDDPAAPDKSAGWITDALPLLETLSRLPDVECLPERFIEYRDWKRERPYQTCYGIRFNTTITPNGKVWVCPNRREFPGSAVGDLNTQSFSEIWAAHPGEWLDFEKCRIFCRLHMVNETAWEIFRPRQHVNFI